MLGSTTPRLFTPPLITGPPGPCGCGCALSPDTSDGFDVDEWARHVLYRPLDPWQRFLVIHGLELLPDGRPRFRTVLVLVARQNGKTETPVILSAFWQFVDQVELVMGTSTKLEYAKESWMKVVKLVERTPALTGERPKRWTRRTNGEQESWSSAGARYKIAAANEDGVRSMTPRRLIMDELRQHHTYAAWDACVPAGNAVSDFQAWCLSNAGSDTSIVLNEVRDDCLAFIDNGEGDHRAGLFEWSAPADADPLDPSALAQANPNLGRRIELDTLIGQARKAVRLGGDALAGFKTEVMCVRVRKLNPALDPAAWERCLAVGDLAADRSRVALCIDLAPDGEHATLAAAAVLADGRVRVEVVKAWEGPACLQAMRRQLPAVVATVRPRAIGWLPGGPGAVLSADIADRRKAGRHGWPPRGVKVDAIRGDLAAVCMGFAEQVKSLQIVHSGDPLLDAHVEGAERLKRPNDTWVFARAGAGHVDALYAAAGAAHLARTLPSSLGEARLIVVTDDDDATDTDDDS